MSLPKHLAKSLVSHFWLKIGSLLLATLIWFSVRSQSRSDRTFVGIPCDIRNIPRNLEIVERGDELLRVVVQGPQNLVASLRDENISISVDLPDDIRSGDITLELAPNNVQLPYARQLSVLQISPETITIRLEELVSKFVKIQPYIRGAVADGFELGVWEIIPSLTQIRGPTSIVESLETVMTEPIDVTGLSMTFNQRVAVRPAEKLISVIEPAQVTATIRINEKLTEIEFSEVPLSLIAPPGLQVIDPQPASVMLRVKGLQRIVSGLDFKQISVSVDCSKLEPGRHEVLAEWKPPEGIQTVVVTPDHIDVLVLDPLSGHPTGPPERRPEGDK